ncbi:deoxyribose-phosphate aldolase [Acidithiobacillus thiooxidans]|uniref:deoxyribose-phosphate aldolase n=1 Tax=Acidithiobacillus thiooxidans TaxID=930 RepID=UPI001C06C087|nr:deoxyribose-phosphate aldolase [Acidithiobacillus thiooxidans]
MKHSIAERIGLLDLTRLEAVQGDEAAVETLCAKARTRYGDVAAVCIHPAYVARAVNLLRETPIAVATVTNFPSGDNGLQEVHAELESVVTAGAQEVDIVVPYKAWLAGDKRAVFRLMEAVQHWLGNQVRIKAILETGAIPISSMRRELSREIAEIGVDFLKTSTGKTAVGATPEAVADLLVVTKEFAHSQVAPGIKVAGGVRTGEQMDAYIAQIEAVMGTTFITPRTLRFGASSLLDDLLSQEAAL